MEIPEQLRCLFSAQVEERNGSYVVEVPKQELGGGTLQDGETYHVAMLPGVQETAERNTGEKTEPRRQRDHPEPPVEEGEIRDVEIEDIGDQGDGITRVERGYVVIVSETEESERVRIEITDVQQNVAFADVVERLSYYD